MKILIIGGVGFIGLHLAHKLLSSEENVVDILDVKPYKNLDEEALKIISHSRCSYIETDITDFKTVTTVSRDYDVIFHLAAMLGVQNVINNASLVLKKNYAMTEVALAIASNQQALQKFFYTSTSEVYAGTLQHYGLPFPTDEGTPLSLPDLDQPRTSYMLSKIYGEALCHHSAVPFIIIRPHNVYGPRMGFSHVISQLLQKAVYLNSQEPLEVYSVEHKRTFCYIDDAIGFLVGLLKIDIKNITLNLGVSQPEVTIGDLAQLILNITNKNVTIKALPATPGSPIRRAPANDKICKLSSYSPRFSLEEGLKRTYEWYINHHFKSSSHK
ncbi:NAD-dependent epimerase/dehydratase family protein [Candidatus Nucleicultrix amoebiphila]|jgi:nucleoside-diphosphate-sugar epimerase|uniref:NAD-dependent epimerase/dehydratase family protein n=1 Tax=Candidatus Nucleicultrix amoebiphila TaxID=1509244 RepID=UPI000A268FFC|nr:NAD(P)-dependent oxidoreductase [Candidatus Nucleicultrix amoebiphila]